MAFPMQSFIAAGVIAVGFTTYPSAGDKVIMVPKAQQSGPVVEMATDKGPIVELVIRCSKGVAIISYSKMERLFCSPKNACDRRLSEVAAKSCG
jgi:hypothetical protein